MPGSRAAANAGSRSARPSPVGRLSSPVLVGRADELGLLLETARCTPAVMMIEGEAGVGKTRLVEELLRAAELRSYQRLVGRCHQLGEPFPLGPVVDALRQATLASRALNPVVGAVRPLLPELARWLPAPLEPLGERRAERHRLFRAIRELLAALGSAVIVLEDLHWADQATVELLRFVFPQLPPGLAVVCTYRREELADASPVLGLAGRLSGTVSLARVVLAPLEPRQVRRLVGEILQSDRVSQEFADYLHERTAGVPLAVEEVLLLLRERADVVQRHGVWVRRELDQIGVPAGLRDSILERLGGQPETARQVLRAAAVLAVPATEQMLLEVAGVPRPRADQALLGALGSRLLVETGEGLLGFRHVLARQAVLDSIAAPQRRRLHLRAVRELEAVTPTPYAQLAHHYRAAGRVAKWLHYAEAAADRATSLQDNATAYELLRDALSVPATSPAVRGRLAVKFGLQAYRCQRADEAIGLLRELLRDDTLEAAVRGELRLMLARLLQQSGQNSYPEVVRALDDLDDHPVLAAEAMVILTRPWVAAGGLDEALHWLDRARTLVDASADPLARSIVATNRAVGLLGFGDRGWRRAIEQIPPAGTNADEIKLTINGAVNLSSAALKVGHYAQAAESIAAGCRLAERSGFQFGGTLLLINQLLLDWATGAWDGLEQRASTLLEAMHDWVQARVDLRGVTGLVMLAGGHLRAAVELLDQPTVESGDLMPTLTWTADAMARVRLAEGDPEAAVREAVRALGPIRDKRLWMWGAEVVPATVEALLAAGRAAEAVELTSQFDQGNRGRDAPAAAAGVLLCRGLVAAADGEHARAARACLAAERAWRTLPHPYQAIRAREQAGCCLLDVEPDRGLRLLAEARDAFAGLGAAWDAARVSRRLREHGVQAPQRRGRRGYGADLSPRERQVAALAGEGLTNHEIAVALFVSTKTVEKHLSSAMRKIGVTSRTELHRQ